MGVLYNFIVFLFRALVDTVQVAALKGTDRRFLRFRHSHAGSLMVSTAYRTAIEAEIAFVMKPKRSETKRKYVPRCRALGSELHTGRLKNRFINSFKVRLAEMTTRVYTLLETNPKNDCQKSRKYVT